MSIDSEMEEAEQEICDRLNNGDISQSQYNKEMSALQRDYSAMADEACQDAYDNEQRNWY